jgi:hypothetical protein
MGRAYTACSSTNKLLAVPFILWLPIIQDTLKYLPKRRRLDENTDGIEHLLKLRSNKKLLQDHIRRNSDKIVTLRDLSNYSAKLKPESTTTLEEVITELQSKGGKYI